MKRECLIKRNVRNAAEQPRYVIPVLSNEAGSKVEADVAMRPPLSLFHREENRDGDTYESYALDSYCSTATYAIKMLVFLSNLGEYR